MSDKPSDSTGRWSKGTSPQSLHRALHDQARLIRGRLRETNEATGYTRAALTRRHYDQLRYRREDLDYREWNAETGYSGVDRTPTGPGVLGEGEKRRRKRRAEIDEGF